MSSIYRYRPHIGRSSLDLMDREGNVASLDLCEIDGWRYVSVADDAVPDVDVVIEPVTLTDELRGAIKQLSPHCRLIKRRAEARISERYSLADRLQIAAIAGGISNGLVEETPGYRAMMEAYRDYVVSVNQWAAGEYGKLGL